MKSAPKTVVDRSLNWRRRWPWVSFFGDILAVNCALAIGFVFSHSELPVSLFVHFQWKLMLYASFSVALLGVILGAYREALLTPMRLQFAVMVQMWSGSVLIIFATLFLYRNTYYSKGALLTFLVIMPCVLLLARGIVNQVRVALVERKNVLRSIRVSLKGGPNEFPELQELLRDTVIESLLEDEHVGIRPHTREFPPDPVTDLERAYSAVLVVVPDRVEAHIGSADIAQLQAPIRILSPEICHTLDRVPRYDGLGIALATSNVNGGNVHSWAKRALDILLSSFLLILLLPIISLIALAIRLDTRGRVVFRQKRYLARESAPVSLLKFRSMFDGDVSGEERSVFVHAHGNGKLRDDPRVTRVGAFLRRYSLDEIPQLLNVLRGDMTFVGPRPLTEHDLDSFPKSEFYDAIMSSRATLQPGITGLWQISGRSDLTLSQMVVLDHYYAEKRSLAFDIEILFRTIPAVLTGRGAF